MAEMKLSFLLLILILILNIRCHFGFVITTFYNNKRFHPSSRLVHSVSPRIDNILEKVAVPPESICKAVDKAPNGRLSVPDAAAISGTDLNTARKALILLASLTRAKLEVTKNGDVIYKFPKNFRAELLSRSVGQKIKNFIGIVWPPLLYSIQISVGIFLVVSVVMISATILFAGSSSSSDNGDDKERSSGSNIYVYSDNYGSSGSSFGMVSFFFTVFSYVFGEGNPNEGKLSYDIQVLNNKNDI